MCDHPAVVDGCPDCDVPRRDFSDTFEVRTKSPMDDRWQERDAEIHEAAGVESSHSGAGFGERDHGWYCQNFSDAVAMKDRLAAVEGVRASIREH